jgi:hypothetical protein
MYLIGIPIEAKHNFSCWRDRVISGTHLELFKRCWIGGIECLVNTDIKKL